MPSPGGEENRWARREAAVFFLALLCYGLFYAIFFIQSFVSRNLLAPSDSFDFGVAAYLSHPAVWTDGMFSGYPIAAEPQSLTWYPLLQACRLLHIDWNIFLISAYAMTGASAFLLVRRLTASNVAAAFGGLVCSFNAFAIGYVGNFNQIHAFAWVPLMFYGLQLIREGHLRGGAVVAAVASALMWLAGHPQIGVYAVYVAGFIVLGELLIDRPSGSQAIGRVGWSLGALLLGILLAAVMFVPMLELSRVSTRSETSFAMYNSSALPPRELLTMVMPMSFGGFWTVKGGVPGFSEGDSAYLGLLPVALAVIAPFVSSRRKDASLWVAVAVLELLLSTGGATPLGVLFYYAPGFASFQAPVRHLFLASLCIAVASGYAVSAIVARRSLRLALVPAVLCVSAIAVVTFFVSIVQGGLFEKLSSAAPDYAWWAIAVPAMSAAALVLIALAGRWLPSNAVTVAAFGVLLVTAHIADLAIVHYRLPGRRFAYADVPRQEAVLRPRMAAMRTELEGTGERILAADGSRNPFLLPNLTRAWDVQVASGSDSMGIQTYMEMLRMGPNGAVSAPSFSAASRSLDLFAVRYALVPETGPLVDDLKRQPERWQARENDHYYEDDPDTHYTLFENLRSRPRAWCVPEVDEMGSDESLNAVRTGRLPDGREFDPARIALVERGTTGTWKGGGVDIRAKVERSAPRTYQVNSTAPCLLVLSEDIYPWWRASVDGTPRGLIRVNHTMIGLPLSPGSHVVRLWLQPTTIWIGIAISVIAVLLVPVILLV